MQPAKRLALTFLTGDPTWARAACAAGADRIMVDLETLGKAARQRGQDLRLSDLQWTDVANVRAVLPDGALMVRIDPYHGGSADQIDRAVEIGADAIMIPYFFDVDDVFECCEIVRGRAIVVPLVETVSASQDLTRLMSHDSINEFHVGLNDLAIDMKLDSHEDVWTSEVLDGMCRLAREAGVPFGVGGVTDPRSEGLALDPSWVIARQAQLGSTSAIIGRHFKEAVVRDPVVERMRDAIDAVRSCYANSLSPD